MKLYALDTRSMKSVPHLLAEVKMTCPQCRHQGHETDIVTPAGGTQDIEETTIGFIHQDPNRYGFRADCPRGHRFSVHVRQVI